MWRCVWWALCWSREATQTSVPSVAFMIYVRQFTNPLSQIAQAATSLQSTAAASQRVFDFLEQEELADESGKTQVLPVEQVRG